MANFLVGIVFTICILVYLTCSVHTQQCTHRPTLVTPKNRINIEKASQSRILTPDQRMKFHVEYNQSVLDLGVALATKIQDVVAEAVEHVSRTLSVKQDPAFFLIPKDCVEPDHTLIIEGQEYCTKGSCNAAVCGDVMVPETLSQPCFDCNDNGTNCTEFGGTAVESSALSQEVHFILFVVSSSTCDEFTLAYASSCYLDTTTERPVAGFMNICPQGYDMDRENLSTLVQHELFHALGFDNGLYALYRDENGDPLTPRDANGLPPLDPVTGLYQWSSRVIRELTLDWDFIGGTTQRTVLAFVTPNIVREARAHFGCPTLMGVEIEDGGGAGTALTHFEKRILATESMTGYHTPVRVFSRMSLALMEDTGWYIPDYEQADIMNWGKDLGCDFVQKSCKNWIDEKMNAGLSIAPWCNVPFEATCYVEGVNVAYCDLVKYTMAVPSIYQVFTEIEGVLPNEVQQYGGDSLADYCPHHDTGLTLPPNQAANNLYCTNNESLFFPFGSNEGDEFLPPNDDGSTDELPISVAFPFFDHDHTSLFVNNNGVISFLTRVSQYTPVPFPLTDGRRLLTPFWADVDTGNGGTVFYRQVIRFPQNDGIFLEADGIIRASFVDMRDFASSWMYIATWDRVAFFGASDTSIRNSFQVVMVTDGRYSFAIFNYGDINWTTGTVSGGDSDTGLGGIPAQVGFNAGDRVTFYSVPGSQTAAVVDIETTSNIGVPGRWVFRTDNSDIKGLECTTSGTISLFPLVGSMLGGTQVFIIGPCFNATNLIICNFDGFETSGRLLSDKIALCVSPTFYKIGQIPLRMSLDDGLTFDFTGLFTIINVEDVSDNVFSSVTESNQRESDFEITWNTDALESVDEVDIVVYGYREDSDVEFSGPVVTLAQGVDYHLGHHSVSRLPDLDTHFDVGVIGVIESGGQGGNSTGAAQWSKVHVLQWHNGDDVTNWCNDWIVEEVMSDLSFLSVTHPCPCTLDQAQIDIGRFSPHPLCEFGISSHSNCIHKPGAIHCVRANTPSTLGGGQECCYGYDGMIINVYDSMGGGYSHRYHHGGVAPYGEPKKVPYLSHYLVDILPWTYCCTYGGTTCTRFGYLRPSQTCNDYEPPSPALGNGDPHISTLDSTTYTFNGHGEFTLLNALNGTFILQARAAPFTGSSDATVFVAMAARFGDSDVIHVQTNERRVLDAYVQLAEDGQNFRRIDFDQASRWSYSGVSVSGSNITSDGIIVAFDGGVGLTLKASEGTMSILLVAPDSFRDQTQGLMGTWSGDSSDDFLTPQGSFLSHDLTTEQLHYQFGLLWEIDAAESLFYYEPGEDHESHTDRTYTPVFEPVANPSVNQSLVAEVCGSNPFCIFDYQTTGSQSFAQNSVKSLVQYQQAVDTRALFVSCPTLPDPANGRAIVTTYMAGGVTRFVCDAGFKLSPVVNLTCRSNGIWSDGDIPTCTDEASGQTTTMPSTKRTSLGPVLSTPAIIGISVGSVILIGLIVLDIILIYRKEKRPPSSGRQNPATDQAEVHENPTYVHA